MRMPLSLFSRWIIKQYNLEKNTHNGCVHLEMRRAIWGLPQAGILANKHLCQKLALAGYFESPLWYFGITFVNKEGVNHLIEAFEKGYKLTNDWMGDLYCRITLWEYVNWTVDISMSGYIKKKLKKYGHIFPGRIQ